MVERVDDTMAARIAASAGMTAGGTSSSGSHVVYDGRRYLVAWRDQWLAWDISVFDEEGRLVTGAADVYINILRDLPGVVIGGVAQTALLIGAGAVALFLLKR